MIQINSEMINEFSRKFNDNNINLLAKNSISSNPLKNVLINQDILQKRRKIFTKKIDIESKVADQESSGRCWLFAFLNVIRLKMIKKYKLPAEFEFSQNYLFFWDKFEKSNFFIHNMIELKKEPQESRLITYFLNNPISDGGQYNMIISLVKKYGIIPKVCMAETYHSSNSSELDDVLSNKLRDYAEKIRNSSNFDIKHALEEVYRLLVIFLGEPPKDIVWEFYNNKKYKKIATNPLQFYKKYVPFRVDDMITLINAPVKNRPFYNLYDIKYFGNVVDGEKTNYINCTIEDLIKIAKKSIDGGDALFFGSDVNMNINTRIGLMNNDLYNFEKFFQFKIDMDKGKRLEYGISRINHAMILRGYNQENRKINRWLVENSWGNSGEFDGDIVMNHNWFIENVFEIVVNKKYIPKNIRDVLKKKPIMLEPWDCFGELMVGGTKIQSK
jgi:bleomycin hydrolase